jgi:glycosyltransferase involved in cell wall biosynthesis
MKSLATQSLLADDQKTSCLTVVVVDSSCFSLPYDYSLCDALQQQGCRIVFVRGKVLVTSWTRPATFEVWNHFYRLSGVAKGTGILRVPRKLLKAAEHVVGMEELAKRVERLKPDIVHFQWLPAPILDGLYLRKFRRIAPLVFTVHNTTPHGTALQRLHQNVCWSSVFRHFEAVIVHSQFSKSQLVEKELVSERNVHVIPHGALDYYVSLHRNQGAQLQVSSADHTVLFFGSIEPYKGLDVLIRAFALLPQGLLTRTQLVVAGSPNSDVGSLRRLARQLGIEERICWKLRFIREDEVPQLFRSATVVALPYRRIDQSGVLLTALAFGKAIIASRVGGFPEVIKEGLHGMLVEPGDVQGLAAGLQSILSNSTLRQSFERAAMDLSTTELNWQTSARETMAVYERVLGRC